MAHSQPDDNPIDNRGDARRATVVAGWFVMELLQDARVNALYVQWRQARAAGGRLLDRALLDPRAAAATLDEIFLHQFDRNELDATQRFVRAELKLEYTWIAPALLHAFRLRVHNERHPENPEAFAVPVYVAQACPTGKAPARDGADLQRNVGYFYRLGVRKQPNDSIKAMAREYAEAAKRDNDSRSVVQKGVEQVRTFMALIERSYIVEKPGYVVTRTPDTEK
jgi:hypothetical protein